MDSNQLCGFDRCTNTPERHRKYQLDKQLYSNVRLYTDSTLVTPAVLKQFEQKASEVTNNSKRIGRGLSDVF